MVAVMLWNTAEIWTAIAGATYYVGGYYILSIP